MNKSQSVLEIIAVTRLIPIIVVFFLGFKFKRPLFSLNASFFALSVTSNVFLQNLVLGGAFATLSAFTLLYILIDEIQHYSKRGTK